MSPTSHSDHLSGNSDSAAPSPKDRIREPTNQDSLTELVERRTNEGWTLVAVEWQRQATPRAGTLHSTEVPYGLQVSHDFLHLEENPLEVEAMIVILDSMVEDQPLSSIASALNQRGLHNRRDQPWTQQQVFDLMPRIVEAAPDIFVTSNWRELRRDRKERRLKAV